MTQNEVDMIVDILRNLWPKWEGNDDELRVWYRKLLPLKYEPTKLAIEDYFAAQTTNYVRPLLMPIKMKALAYGAGVEQGPEPEEQRGDVLTGREAQRIAEANILAGPDTPAKRWVLRLRAKKKAQAAKKHTSKRRTSTGKDVLSAVTTLGDALTAPDDIPF